MKKKKKIEKEKLFFSNPQKKQCKQNKAGKTTKCQNNGGI